MQQVMNRVPIVVSHKSVLSEMKWTGSVYRRDVLEGDPQSVVAAGECTKLQPVCFCP